MHQPTLIRGSTGSFGGALAFELLARGREVRLLVRDLDKARARFGNRANGDYIKGDVLDAPAVKKAAIGCGAIIHGVNYPYHLWSPNMTTATENVVAAARAATNRIEKETGEPAPPVTILFPGNVYGLGPPAGDAPIDEGAPNSATTRKGALRAQLEESLKQATVEGQVRAIVLRANDYFGPTARNGLVDPIFKNALAEKTLRTFGRLDIPHQWAYLPDLARCAADLLDMAPTLAPFEIINFAGYTARPQRSFLQLIAAGAGFPRLKAARIPWWMVRLMGLYNPVARELLELRYLWDRSLVLSDEKVRRLLPGFVQTPIEDAIKTTLASYRHKP
jgi:nucleoside-diphosphate-sugar epimerase